jgi:UDP-glucose:(heptosyl)LPS alpha-1,3-glucosyltransferase
MERIRFRVSPGKVVIACSDSLRTEIEKAYPTLKGKVYLLEPGVHLPTLYNNQEKLEFRNELYLSSAEFVLLFVANDYEKKGLRPLLKALQTLPSDITLLVVGNSAHIAKYSELVRQLGVAHQVRFIGSVNSVDVYYRVADALIHPTTEDSFSMVTLEALSHGLPIIVSGPAFCGISSSLKDQVDVLMLQDPRDPSEIAYCVNRLLTDRELRTELGEFGRKFAAKYGWDEIARKQEEIYFFAIEAKRSSNLNR